MESNPTPGIFISYASEQEAFAQQVEKELTANDITVWRDKTNLHAGQRWPKALGDAIAASDAMVLLWSTQANQSDFVELEWNIAMALQKPIIPCPLDDASLPPTLKPSDSITGENIQQAAEQILTALKGLPPSAPIKQQDKLLKTLDTIPAAEPQQVLNHLNTIINQPNWSVGGNVYQAQGDIHITKESPKTAKTWVERAGAWVALVAGLLGIVVVVAVDLPEKLGWKQNNTKTEKSQNITIQKYPFEGQVIDLQGQGLADVNIVLTVPGQKPQTFTTKKPGVFTFDVLTEAGKGATLQAQKPGFKPKRRNVTIPDQRYVLKMEPISEEERP